MCGSFYLLNYYSTYGLCEETKTLEIRVFLKSNFFKEPHPLTPPQGGDKRNFGVFRDGKAIPKHPPILRKPWLEINVSCGVYGKSLIKGGLF